MGCFDERQEYLMLSKDEELVRAQDASGFEDWKQFPGSIVHEEDGEVRRLYAMYKDYQMVLHLG